MLLCSRLLRSGLVGVPNDAASFPSIRIATINAQMARMNAHMKAKAAEYGFAYFSLDAVYALAKPAFSISGLLFSSAPFGANISLDGVHPSAQGQGLLAAAAARGITEA